MVRTVTCSQNTDDLLTCFFEIELETLLAGFWSQVLSPSLLLASDLILPSFRVQFCAILTIPPHGHTSTISMSLTCSIILQHSSSICTIRWTIQAHMCITALALHPMVLFGPWALLRTEISNKSFHLVKRVNCQTLWLRVLSESRSHQTHERRNRWSMLCDNILVVIAKTVPLLFRARTDCYRSLFRILS